MFKTDEYFLASYTDSHHRVIIWWVEIATTISDSDLLLAVADDVAVSTILLGHEQRKSRESISTSSPVWNSFPRSPTGRKPTLPRPKPRLDPEAWNSWNIQMLESLTHLPVGDWQTCYCIGKLGEKVWTCEFFYICLLLLPCWGWRSTCAHKSTRYHRHSGRRRGQKRGGPGHQEQKWWDIASRSKNQSPEMTDSSQSHDGLLLEPWRTPHRAKTDSW